MIKKIFFLNLIVSFVNDFAHELELLDEIKSEIVYLDSDNPETKIITQQEIFRRGFDGKQGGYQVDFLEDETIADEFSKILKATITNEDINKNLKRRGLTEDKILQIVDAWRFASKEEFFDDLKRIFRANGALNFEVESQLVFTNDVIQKYYDEHINDYQEEAKYFVDTAFIPFSISSKEQIKKEIDDFVAGNISKPSYVEWVDAQINGSEITKNNEYILNLEIGNIHVKETDDGFILTKMKNKVAMRTIPCQEVQENIVRILKDLKYDEIIEDVKEKLRSKAIIIRPDEIYKVPVNTGELNK